MLKMIDTVYYNDELRCSRNGVVERFYRNCYWKIVENNSNNNGYNQIKINNKMILRHRLIAFCFLGLEDIVGRLDKTNVIDHIDGNPSNNAVNNLRITNNSGNQHNRKNAKGFHFNKRDKKYQAQIMINNKHIHLGSYETEEEAKQAYLEGKRKYHLW
jgi:hypothetical protein